MLFGLIALPFILALVFMVVWMMLWFSAAVPAGPGMPPEFWWLLLGIGLWFVAGMMFYQVRSWRWERARKRALELGLPPPAYLPFRSIRRGKKKSAAVTRQRPRSSP